MEPLFRLVLFVARYQLYLPKKEELQAQLDKVLNETQNE